jgi:glutaredoxin
MKISGPAREIIGKWSGEQQRRLEMRLTAADHPRTAELRAFSRWLAGSCEMVTVSEVETSANDLPALSLRQGSIVYRAVPAGPELVPFLEALAGDGAGDGRFRAAALRIYVAAACPHCPAAVRALLPLVVPGGPVTLEVIDSEACDDLARADRIKSVPTLILDGDFRWTGSARPGDLEAMLAPGDRVFLGADVLERLLENGNAGPLSRMMIDAGEASPALCTLLAGEAMSVRLGAMMVMEELLLRAPALVELLVPDLQDNFAGAPEPAQGDMLYILGEAGPPELAGDIEALLRTGLHPEVEEAAREALDRLAERHQ